MEDIKNRLSEIFEDIFDDEMIEITENLTADDVEDWDSLAHVRLIIAIEREFGFEFSATEIENFTNVGAMMKTISAKLNG